MMNSADNDKKIYATGKSTEPIEKQMNLALKSSTQKVSGRDVYERVSRSYICFLFKVKTVFPFQVIQI